MKDTKKIIKSIIICTIIIVTVQVISTWMLADYISQTAGDIHQGLQQIQVKL